MSPSPNIGGRVPPVPYGSTPLQIISVSLSYRCCHHSVVYQIL